MSYNPQQPRPGGPARPLIQRPRTTQQPPSALGSAVAGALNGMGLGWGVPTAQQQQVNSSVPQMGAPPHPSLPQAPHLAGFNRQQGSAQPSYYGTAAAPVGAYNPAFGLPPVFQQSSAYPPSFYPPQHQQPSPYPSQPGPRTTAEGYTISSVYVAPPPSAAPPPQAGPSSGRAPKQKGPKSKGAGAGPAAPPPPPASFKCCKEDCTFTGGQRQVREHEEDRHLIFAPGREPKPWKGSYAPKDGARIEGTNISLDSPEAVAQWIADRKKRWPSNKVVQEKEAARAERIAAGLEQPTRGRGRGRGRGDARGSRGGRGGRGGGRAGEPLAKRAKIEGASSDESSSNSDDSDSDSDDSEEDSDEDGPPEATSAKVEVPSMFELDGAKGEEEPRRPGKPTIHPSRMRQEEGDEGTEMSEEGRPEEVKKIQVVCKHWRAGECGLGDSCPYLHSIPTTSAPRLPPKRKRPAPPPAPRNPFARTTDPWAQLEERDWRHVVSDVLQVVDFLTKNDFLRGVERRVGEIEEEGRIEDLGEVPHGDEEMKGGKAAGIEEVALAEKAVDDGPTQEPVDEGAAAEEDAALGQNEENSFDLGQEGASPEDAEANEQADDEFLEQPSDDEEGGEETAQGDALMAYLDEEGDVELAEDGEGEGSAEVTVDETGDTISV